MDCGTCQLGTTDSGTVVRRSPYEPRPPQDSAEDAELGAANDPDPRHAPDGTADGDPDAADINAATDASPVVAAVPEVTTQPLASDELELVSSLSETTGRYDLRALQRLIALGPVAGAMPDTREVPVEAVPPPAPRREEPPTIVAGDIEVVDDDPTPDPHRQVLPEPEGPKTPYFVRPRVRRRGGQLQPPELRWRPCTGPGATMRTAPIAPEPGAPRSEWGKPAPSEETQLSAQPSRPTPYWEAPAPGDTQVAPAPTAARPG